MLWRKENVIMNQKVMKIAGIALTIVGAGVSLATNVLEEKKLDAKVAEKVAEALAKNK